MWMLSKLVPVIKTPPPNKEHDTGINGENIIKDVSQDYIMSTFTIPIHKKDIPTVESFYRSYFLNGGRYVRMSLTSECGATICFTEKQIDKWVVGYTLPIITNNTSFN